MAAKKATVSVPRSRRHSGRGSQRVAASAAASPMPTAMPGRAGLPP
jgi:hypothetical protein